MAATDYRNLTLKDAEAEAAAIAQDARLVFGGLDAEQLNWRPDATRWSVAQCFDHLLQSNREMLQAMDRALDPGVPRQIWQRVPVLPDLMARLLINSLGPEGKNKFTATIAIPASSAIDADVIERFAASQSVLETRFRELSQQNVTRVRMLSPFASMVAYSVLDGCRIVIAHQRRHFEQARRVTETPGFPARG